jgi:hypothetical protein
MFKIGDIIKCVDHVGVNLTRNNHYTVLEGCTDSYVSVMNDKGMRQDYYIKRFIPINANRKFKTGDVVRSINPGHWDLSFDKPYSVMDTVGSKYITIKNDEGRKGDYDIDRFELFTSQNDSNIKEYIRNKLEELANKTSYLGSGYEEAVYTDMLKNCFNCQPKTTQNLTYTVTLKDL